MPAVSLRLDLREVRLRGLLLVGVVLVVDVRLPEVLDGLQILGWRGSHPLTRPLRRPSAGPADRWTPTTARPRRRSHARAPRRSSARGGSSASAAGDGA